MRLVRARAFADGNRRAGSAAALVFLALNGQPVHVPPVDLYDLTMRVAMGRAREAWVTAWLRKRMGTRGHCRAHNASGPESTPGYRPAIADS